MRNEQLQSEVQAALGADYTITRELPRGGMSRVFVATENALGRQVVIKVLSPELAATLSAERFKREIGLAARLQHPHIVPLLSAGQAGRHLYYTMPLVTGESLRDRISRERPMPIATILRILEEVSRALAYAHDEGIAHRDIKPENVMFFHGQAVVLDFGIGKALQRAAVEGSATESARITMPGTSLGTPTYIAPEQAAGDPDLDHRADLYALGVVAYEMLTGHPPFANRSPQVVMAAHAQKLPDPIGPRRPDAPAHLVNVVMQCLEKRPADRPATGHEIARALDPASAATATGVGEAMARLPAWLPWAIAAASFAVTLALAALLLARGR
ncbi:MAG: serine/threonine-protein kinase [Gemmatimonadaceae bacterium]